MGRQPMKPRSVKVPDDEWEAAMAAADKRGDVLSQVIRAALKRYVRSTASK